MKKLLLLVFLYALPLNAQPIVPSFTTGTVSSTTNTEPHQSMRLSLLQIIMVILMSILLLGLGSQPMDQSLQIQRMLMGQ